MRGLVSPLRVTTLVKSDVLITARKTGEVIDSVKCFLSKGNLRPDNQQAIGYTSYSCCYLPFTVITISNWGLVWFMVFNATLCNISVISCRSFLLVEETGIPGENHYPVARHWQTLSLNLFSGERHRLHRLLKQCVWWASIPYGVLHTDPVIMKRNTYNKKNAYKSQVTRRIKLVYMYILYIKPIGKFLITIAGVVVVVIAW
jgi:hypothetical protein